MVYLKQLIGDTTDVVSQSELSKKLAYRMPVELFQDIIKEFRNALQLFERGSNVEELIEGVIFLLFSDRKYILLLPQPETLLLPLLKARLLNTFYL